MAQPLVFIYGEKELPFQLKKVDRSSLYGYVDVETLDDRGRPCKLATLAGDGRTIVDSGGTALAYLSPDGLWRDKGKLKPVDPNGESIEPVPSTFKAATVLENRTDIDDYLSHNIRSVYMMDCEDDWSELGDDLKNGAIFSFPFSYRGSLEADTAFLLAGSDGNIFMCVGKKTDIQFYGFEQAAPADLPEEEDADEDDMDFGML